LNAKRRGRWIWGWWLVLAVLAACTTPQPLPTETPLPPTVTLNTPDPQGTAATFLSAWQAGDYAGMYSLLSPLSQASINFNDFQARYADIAKTSTLTSLETRVLSALKNGTNAHVLYSVDFHTTAIGEIVRQIDMPLAYVNNRWAVSWTDSLILPELAGGNTLLMQYTAPVRANIYDRNGLGLALTVKDRAVEVQVQPGLIKDEAAMLATLSPLLNLAPADIKKKYASAPPDWEVSLGVISAEVMQANSAALQALSGVTLNPYNIREYPDQGVAPQLVGYMINIPPEQLAAYQAQGYTGDERVGGSGLEAWGEKYLTGGRSGTLYVVTPSGQISKLVGSQPKPAQSIYSTIDRTLQIAAQQALGNFRGSITILNPATGEVLAMVSNPTFDPNLFEPTNQNSSTTNAILNDPGKPLLNRAAQSQYPPGSVFKIPMMGAALLSGLYTRDTPYTCTGVWNLLGPTALKYDWTVQYHSPPHGKINLVQALAFSCDTYFYTVAYDLYNYNPSFMSQIAVQFGLGQPTQIGQIAEAPGLMPDPQWKLNTLGEPWVPGDSVNMGIGQGFVQVTPLQIADMVAAVRNGGTLYRPQLVHHIAPPIGPATYEFTPIVNGHLPVTAEQLGLIQEGLRDATTQAGGTARHRFLNIGIPVAGKTGTAEDPGSGGPPHAWFAGYTEANRPDKPDIAIVVMVENIGEGSDYAAPIFRRIVEDYFLGRPYTLYPWETEFNVTATPAPTPELTPTP
jgi:penicillin-binding protein 2